MEWQPIETAPRREYVLVTKKDSDWQPVSALYGIGNIHIGEGWYSDYYKSASELLPFDPTHWQPLPKPPDN